VVFNYREEYGMRNQLSMISQEASLQSLQLTHGAAQTIGSWHTTDPKTSDATYTPPEKQSKIRYRTGCVDSEQKANIRLPTFIEIA
jgi:hypothetical protein